MRYLLSKLRLFSISAVCIICVHLVISDDVSENVQNNTVSDTNSLTVVSSEPVIDFDRIRPEQDSDDTDVEVEIEAIETEELEHFNPTDDWQTVLPNQSIPAGCHVRISMTTGLKEAKWAENRNTHKFKSTKDNKSSLNENNYNSYVKNFAYYNEMNTTLSILNQLENSLSEQNSSEARINEIAEKLDKLSELVSDIGIAEFIVQTKYFALFKTFFNSEISTHIIPHLSRVLAYLWQNNQKVQLIALEEHFLQFLIQFLSKYNSNNNNNKNNNDTEFVVFFPITTLLRGLPYGMGALLFIDNDLPKVVLSYLRSYEISHVIRVLQLIDDLTEELTNDIDLTGDTNSVQLKKRFSTELWMSGCCEEINAYTRNPTLPEQLTILAIKLSADICNH